MPERPITPIDKSRQLQRKLFLAAKRNRERRFHALYDRIYRPDILWRAWQEVRKNGGSAGVDGISIEDIEMRGVEQWLHSIAADLKAKEYRPQAVLRVYIPKPDGRQRPLGIPIDISHCTSLQSALGLLSCFIAEAGFKMTANSLVLH